MRARGLLPSGLIIYSDATFISSQAVGLPPAGVIEGVDVVVPAVVRTVPDDPAPGVASRKISSCLTANAGASFIWF